MKVIFDYIMTILLYSIVVFFAFAKLVRKKFQHMTKRVDKES